MDKWVELLATGGFTPYDPIVVRYRQLRMLEHSKAGSLFKEEMVNGRGEDTILWQLGVQQIMAGTIRDRKMA